jgi:hypothetical protein
MMRALCLILIAANLLFFAWTHWVDTAPRAQPATARGASAAPTPGPLTAPVEACTSLGPFPDSGSLAQASAALGAAGKRPEPREEQVRTVDGYVVVVAGIDSRTAQRAALRGLRQAGIADAVASSDDASLQIRAGEFAQPGLAEQRATRLRGLKFDARVEEEFRTDTRLWLDVHGASAESLGDAARASLGIPTAGLTTGACPN